jgi:F-type H+-transporting ATPase subunit delta
MKISKQARRDAKQLFRSSLVNSVLDESRARQAVKLLLEKKPRGYPQILNHFQRLLKLDEERRSAKVESAVALSPGSQNEIKTQLAKRYGQGLNISFAQNPSLLGGLRVKVGSDVYDGSVKARLDALAETF